MLRKAATYTILCVIGSPAVLWFSSEAYSHLKKKSQEIDRNTKRLIKIESDYTHIKENLIELKDGQKEIRAYIINQK